MKSTLTALIVFKLLALAFFLPETAVSAASSNDDVQAPVFRFYGFVKHDFFYDTREMVAARQGQYTLHPSAPSLNENGNDINEGIRFHMLSIQSRIGLEVTGPDAFGASSRGLIEGAFFGNIESDINGFRLRHAFVELNWDGTHKLLAGQFWHPLFAERAVPGVVSFNTGAPFKPFSRNPQIRYTWSPGQFSVILAALSQIDFVSQGGTEPIRRSGVPNLHAQLQFENGGFITGAGFDYKTLQPIVFTGEERLHSYAGTLFGNYRRGTFQMLLQATYGQNLYDHLMLGGFATNQAADAPSTEYDLVNINTGAAWIDLSAGGSTRVGLFAGYTQNFGADQDFTPAGPGWRGADIDHIWRISPRVEWSSGPVKLSLEAEISQAAYGTTELNGTVRDLSEATNYRLLFASWFFF